MIQEKPNDQATQWSLCNIQLLELICDNFYYNNSVILLKVICYHYSYRYLDI